MDIMVKDWQDFLDSLSTKGGNILLMFLALVGLMWFVHHLGADGHVDDSILSASHDMMVGFGAALLAVLSGSSSKQQMADRIDIAKSTTLPPNTTTVETTSPLNLSTTPAAPAPVTDPNPPSPWVKK